MLRRYPANADGTMCTAINDQRFSEPRIHNSFDQIEQIWRVAIEFGVKTEKTMSPIRMSSVCLVEHRASVERASSSGVLAAMLVPKPTTTTTNEKQTHAQRPLYKQTRARGRPDTTQSANTCSTRSFALCVSDCRTPSHTPSDPRKRCLESIIIPTPGRVCNASERVRIARTAQPQSCARISGL